VCPENSYLPHMDGEKCFPELRHVKSDVRVIMSSGYAEQEVIQRFAGLIQKPYQLATLRAKLREVWRVEFAEGVRLEPMIGTSPGLTSLESN